jgi:hypothetical protein
VPGQLTTYIQTRLTDFSDYRTAADVELTHIGAIKTILSEASRHPHEATSARPGPLSRVPSSYSREIRTHLVQSASHWLAPLYCRALPSILSGAL